MLAAVALDQLVRVPLQQRITRPIGIPAMVGVLVRPSVLGHDDNPPVAEQQFGIGALADFPDSRGDNGQIECAPETQRVFDVESLSHTHQSRTAAA
jgi:hypothetical protein